MPKRRGFLRRITDAIRGAISGEPRRKASREEVRRFARGGRGSARVAEQYAKDRRDAAATQQAKRKRDYAERRRRERQADPYRFIWREQRAPRGQDFGQHVRIFESLPGVEDMDDNERENMWRMYIQYMTRGHHRYNDIADNPFWSELGISPRDFRWADWRVARGYSRR